MSQSRGDPGAIAERSRRADQEGFQQQRTAKDDVDLLKNPVG